MREQGHQHVLEAMRAFRARHWILVRCESQWAVEGDALALNGNVVKCPVCSTPLTADDLRPDPVLLRRVRRAQELQECG
jgi:predicted Zn finger-like uncharacterized protein